MVARDSIGVTLAGDGRITEVVPGMSGDRAGLAPGMKVIGVNEKTFSRQRLLNALVDGVKLHKVELLLIEGRRFRTVTMIMPTSPVLCVGPGRIEAGCPRPDP